jgi:putative transposase
MAESFVDSFTTELSANRDWRSRSQLEFAIIEWVAWFNTNPLTALGDLPPTDVEAQCCLSQADWLEPSVLRAHG